MKKRKRFYSGLLIVLVILFSSGCQKNHTKEEKEIPKKKEKAIGLSVDQGFASRNYETDIIKEEAEKLGIEKPIIVGVTVLTSLSNQDLQDIGCNMTTEELAIKRAKLAKEAGIDGIVCSAQEVDKIVEACGKDFVTVCPGIRPANASVGDQKRVVTPKDAINKGAHYLVVGRPITKAENPSEAAINIVKEIENA